VIVVWFLAGVGLGAIAGLSQHWTVEYVDPEAPGRVLPLVLGGMLIRVGLAGVLLFGAIQSGIWSALAALAGLLLARTALLVVAGRGRGVPVASSDRATAPER
jgi:hypothetical protein